MIKLVTLISMSSNLVFCGILDNVLLVLILLVYVYKDFIRNMVLIYLYF